VSERDVLARRDLPEEGSVTGTTEHDVGQQRIAALQMANAVRRA
jgi:hypothetical protein